MRRALRRAALTLLAASAPGLAGPAVAQTPPPASAEALPPADTAREGHGRLEQMKVEMAWLADPATFGCPLAARTVDGNLEVHGFVPRRELMDRALRTARAHTRLPVVNVLQVRGDLAPRETGVDGDAVRQGAVEVLNEGFGMAARGFEIRAGDDGRVTVNGSVNSVEEKLAVSRRLRKVRGCTCVSNYLQISPVMREGRMVTQINAAGTLVVPGQVLCLDGSGQDSATPPAGVLTFAVPPAPAVTAVATRPQPPAPAVVRTPARPLPPAPAPLPPPVQAPTPVAVVPVQPQTPPVVTTMPSHPPITLNEQPTPARYATVAQPAPVPAAVMPIEMPLPPGPSPARPSVALTGGQAVAPPTITPRLPDPPRVGPGPLPRIIPPPPALPPSPVTTAAAPARSEKEVDLLAVPTVPQTWTREPAPPARKQKSTGPSTFATAREEKPPAAPAVTTLNLPPVPVLGGKPSGTAAAPPAAKPVVPPATSAATASAKKPAPATHLAPPPVPKPVAEVAAVKDTWTDAVPAPRPQSSPDHPLPPPGGWPAAHISRPAPTAYVTSGVVAFEDEPAPATKPAPAAMPAPVAVPGPVAMPAPAVKAAPATPSRFQRVSAPAAPVAAPAAPVSTAPAGRIKQQVEQACGKLARKVDVAVNDKGMTVRIQCASADAAQRATERVLVQVPEMASMNVKFEVSVGP